MTVHIVNKILTLIKCHCHFKTMMSDVHARDSVMTSFHETWRTCNPGLTLLVYWGWGRVGKVGLHF